VAPSSTDIKHTIVSFFKKQDDERKVEVSLHRFSDIGETRSILQFGLKPAIRCKPDE